MYQQIQIIDNRRGSMASFGLDSSRDLGGYNDGMETPFCIPIPARNPYRANLKLQIEYEDLWD